jgi:asparagine N-glycosylation enzyme membrane subunit Stt3
LDQLLEKRRLYFAFLFSSFIFFALLILLKIPLNPFDIGYPVYILSIFSVLPAYLFFGRKKISFKNQLILGYVPLIAGFVISIIFNNSIYFLISFPIFLLNYIIIMPRR